MDTFDYQKHIKALYKSASRQFEFSAKSFDEFEKWKLSFRSRLLEALGISLMKDKLYYYQPSAKQVSSKDLGDYVREKWYLTVEPTVPLPFWLLLPKNKFGRLPLVLTPHGHNHPDLYVGIAHNDQEKKRMVEGERDIAVQAVKEGYIVIAPTSRAFGETKFEFEHNKGKISSCRTELVHNLLVGRTPIGERIWDISRLIDWALIHLNVDKRRIAITGNSGGGTISLFASACDERITVAVPSCYFCTFEDSIGIIHHCECNYIPGILELGEMFDVAGLIAPRPFCAIAGKDDPIFPLKGVKYAFNKLRHIYGVAGVPERCELYVGEGGHRYYKQGAWPFIRKWFERFGKANFSF